MTDAEKACLVRYIAEARTYVEDSDAFAMNNLWYDLDRGLNRSCPNHPVIQAIVKLFNDLAHHLRICNDRIEILIDAETTLEEVLKDLTRVYKETKKR